MQTFDTGATRSGDDGKYDWDGFLSPLALARYGEYMHGHRIQEDGKLRASDNWQKGIPASSYMKSMWRHFLAVWAYHRGWPDKINVEVEDALCGVIFNAMGMLHERMAGSSWPVPSLPPPVLEKVEVGMVQECPTSEDPEKSWGSLGQSRDYDAV